MTYTIYMFHAIGDVSDLDWADPHYSYSLDKFNEFLDRVKSVSSISEQLKGGKYCNTILTFDDGHISNYQAAKYLYENKIGSADFFINPELVGSDYYMSWDQIRELHSMGMSIQSHGLDHQYLSDCDDQELHRQLLESKIIIEKQLSSKVTILAPPGGRYDSRTVKLAKRVGYKCIANSEPGTIKSLKYFLVPRASVTHNYSVDDLIQLSSPWSVMVLKQKLKYGVLKLAKRLLGNSRYEKIRFKILGDI